MTVHQMLATASQNGSLQDIVCALESILNVISHSTQRTTSSSSSNDATKETTMTTCTNNNNNNNNNTTNNLTDGKTSTTTTTTTTTPDVLNANTLLSLLKNRDATTTTTTTKCNKYGEVMKCVSILFFIPAIESSGPTGTQHTRLVNAFVSTMDAPICCAVQRGCAEMVETYLALLVIAKIIAASAGPSSSSSSSKQRFLKSADYKALTFLEWLERVKFFGRTTVRVVKKEGGRGRDGGSSTTKRTKKRVDGKNRTLYSEWALHAGNDDTLHVLTQNEYTLRDLAEVICQSPFGRMILTRPNFFFAGDKEETATTMDYDKILSSSSSTTNIITLTPPTTSTMIRTPPRTPPECEPSHVDRLLNNDNDDDRPVRRDTNEDTASKSLENSMKDDNFLKPCIPVADCPVKKAKKEEKKKKKGLDATTTLFTQHHQEMTDASPSTFGEKIPETDTPTTPLKDPHQTVAAPPIVLVEEEEEDYEDIPGSASISWEDEEEEDDDDFYLVPLEDEYTMVGSMAMETEWEILSS